jgi:2-oxoglutarate ferredoxin oxidoreductase subunit beta
MVYIVMNNGCYGLTKGQDSATADEGSKSKKGTANPFQPIDLAGLALELGASFVAQSFSGDSEQLVPLIKAAIEHPGFAFINVISPCVTFNNNPGSTKSYDFVREHMEAATIIDFVPPMKEITTNYEKGAGTDIRMHDGSFIHLEKLAAGIDPYDRQAAITSLLNSRAHNEILTGLLYIEPLSADLHHTLQTSERPLNSLPQADLCPGAAALAAINMDCR